MALIQKPSRFRVDLDVVQFPLPLLLNTTHYSLMDCTFTITIPTLHRGRQTLSQGVTAKAVKTAMRFHNTDAKPLNLALSRGEDPGDVVIPSD